MIKTKGQIALDNGFNLKTEITKELTKLNLPLPKIKFNVSSPYQKRRYKPEFVEQECWLIFPNDNNPCNTCVTQDDWQNLEYREVLLADIKHSILLTLNN